MTAIDTETTKKLGKIFFPYATKKADDMKGRVGRFVYYTTADVATSILNKQTIWMRNAIVMNDFSEISHGFDCLNASYKGPAGKLLKETLDSAFPKISEEIETLFNSWLPTMRSDTYLICMSEHRDDEDINGRLSMWRAYGGSTGVALVLNSAAMFSESNALNIFSSPVYYASADQFANEFENVVKGIQAEIELVKQLGRDATKNAVFAMLRFSALCTKHPGFHEELEWRVIACPKMYPTKRVTSDIEVVRGIPQIVLKLPLQNVPEEGLKGLAIPELLNRIIIGPCEFPLPIYQAFHELLNKLKVPDSAKKIIVSEIPLRQLG